MSTRAYRLIEVKSEDNPTFNVTHQYELLSELGAVYDERFMRVPVDNLKKLLADDARIKLNNLDEYDIERIKDDIAHAEKWDDEFVEYYCF